MSRRAVLRWAALALVLFALTAAPIGRFLIRVLYEGLAGERLARLIAGGSRESSLEQYLEILGPFTFTATVWAGILAALFAIMAEDLTSLWRRLAGSPPWLLLTAVHLLAWGPLLLSARGVYWDDWTFYGRPLSETVLLHLEGGRPINPLFDVLVLTIGTAGLSILSLLIHLLVGIGFFAVLERGQHGTHGERLIAAAILLAAPLNAARQTYAVFQYTFGLGLLLAAWFVLIRRQKGPRGGDLLLAGALLTVASFTPSIALFSYVMLLHVAFVITERFRRPRDVKRLLPLTLVPVTVVLIDLLVFVPTGSMEDYNAIEGLALARWLGTAALLGVATLVAFLLRRRATDVGSPSLSWILPVSVGLMLIVISLMPYAAVGRVPNLRFPPYGLMGTRHELLLGFGVATLFVGVLRPLRALIGRHATNVVASVLVLSLAAQSAVISQSYWVERQKQVQFMDQVGVILSAETLRSTEIVVIRDRTTDCNALTRDIRPDEWEAQLRLVEPGFSGHVSFDVGTANPDVVIIVENSRPECEMSTELQPLWSQAGLPRLIRLPKLVVIPPKLVVSVEGA